MLRFLSKTDARGLEGTALLRLDFNTEDEWRMQASLPTVRFLWHIAEKVIIVSHRGRPEGYENKYSLRRDALALERKLKQRVHFVPFGRPAAMRQAIRRAPKKAVFLLENLRFFHGEKDNDASFARWLGSLADYYVNDAFAVCHRKVASVVAVTKFLRGYVGLGLEQELRHLSHVMRQPEQPLVVILGGGKTGEKLGVIRSLRKRANALLLGGASANALLALNGTDVQKSSLGIDAMDWVELVAISKYRNVVLPVDWRKENGAILDIGPKTAELFARKIAHARTIIWSGPVGFIEDERFTRGSIAVARAIAANRRAFSLVGGGETVTLFKKTGLDQKVSFISTGGGAMLDFLAGKKLPGVEALKRGR